MIKATLIFEIEYEDDEIEADPSEMLLEILADQSDAFLMDCITVERAESI